MKNKVLAMIGALAVAGFMSFSQMAYASSDALVNDDYSPTLTPAENALLNSSTPATIYVDQETGEMLSAVPTEPAIVPFGVYPNNCTNEKACWYSYYAPGAYYGFDGLGSAAGPWYARGNFYSGKYSGKPCWLNSAGNETCTNSFSGKYATVTLNNVTGSSVFLK